jgi:serine/threonine protein kinase
MLVTVGDYSYNEKDELGRGGYGVTYLGKNNITNNPVAIKITHTKIDITKQKSNEIDALKKLYEDGTTSPYVMKYYDDFIAEINGSLQRVLVLEYIEGEDIMTFCDFEHFKNPIKLWRLIYQLLLGLQFIHSKGLSHRDIHMYNIMLTKNDTVKYIDFGESCLGTCPRDNKDCQNVCDTIQSYQDYKPVKKSLLEHQRGDLSNLHFWIGSIVDSRMEYLEFMENTPLKNNFCNLAEVIADDGRTQQFMREMFKLINTNIETILAAFTNIILTPPFEGKQITLDDLTRPLPTSSNIVRVGNYFYNKKDKLESEDYKINYIGYDRSGKLKVSIRYVKWDAGNFRTAMNEINAYEKLYEDEITSRYVAKYYNSFITETGFYLVMEYIEGANLVESMEEKQRIILSNPLTNWALMYQLILGEKFIIGGELVKFGPILDNISLSGNLLKYNFLNDYSIKKCPKSNKDCDNLYVELKNKGKDRNLFFLYDNLKLFYPNSHENKDELPRRNEYIDRTKSFLDETKLVLENEDASIKDIIILFQEEILSQPYQGTNLTIAEDYADYSEGLPVPFEEVINYIILRIYKPNFSLKAPFPEDEEFLRYLSRLEKYYSQIKQMCINPNKLLDFNRILKRSLLANKKEQFRNFPSRNIFVEFYALFNMTLDLVSAI